MREPKIIENAVESVQVFGHVFFSWIDLFSTSKKKDYSKLAKRKAQGIRQSASS